MPTKEFPFLIGSDPEFSVLFQNKRILARQILRKVVKNVEWRDMGFRTAEMKGEVGWDGCDATGELRPDPSNTVDGCVENMRSMLKETHKHLNAFSLSTLSTFAPIGGHLHLDIPRDWQSETIIRQNVNKLLSYYLPVTLNENPISRVIRVP
jgi:hypothetical protein